MGTQGVDMGWWQSLQSGASLWSEATQDPGL